MFGFIRSTFKDAAGVSFSLFKVMIPIIIAVKILKELGLISLLAKPLAPFMGLVGLPDSMGLVLATAFLNNIYSAMIVFVSLAPEASVSVAQCTVLCTMMLIAHNLPVELKVAEKCGTSLLSQGVLRVGGAFLCGWLMHLTFTSFDLLQDPNVIFWQPEQQPGALDAWAWGQVRNLFSIFLIIFGLLLVMKAAKKIGLVNLLNRLLRPVLRAMGIGGSASTITVVGLSLGITYGSGLILHEVRQGGVDRRDLFFSVSLMGLSHALVEDTLLMLMLGAHLSGVLFGRLVFSLLLVTLLVRLVTAMSEEKFEKLLMSRG